MSQDPVQIVMQLFEMSNKRDLEGLKALALPDCTLVSPYPAHLPFSGQATGPEACAALLGRMAEPFDMLGMDVKEVIAQGETVVIVAEEKLRAKSTGKTMTNPVVSIVKVKDGKFVSSRSYGDTFGVSELLRSNEAPKAAARAAPAKKSAAGAKKKNTMRAKPAAKNTVKAAKKGKSAASSKKKTARARA